MAKNTKDFVGNDDSTTRLLSQKHDQRQYESFERVEEAAKRQDEYTSKPTSRNMRPCYSLLSIAGILVGLIVLHDMTYQSHPFLVLQSPLLDLYDYIVVGGGPAGIIVATFLATHFPTLQILLLESGTVSQTSVLEAIGSSTRSSATQAPLDDSSVNKFDVPLFWSGLASSQGRRQVLHMHESWSDHHWPIQRTLLARALGGCGMHNAMIYVRALPTDFQRWNLSSWSFERDILPLYVALERLETDRSPPAPFWSVERALPSWRGKSGPITTVRAGSTGAVDAVAQLFVQSARAAGHRLASQGFNDPDPAARIGAGYYDFNIHNGMRGSVARALLQTPLPSNLLVRTGVTVTRVLTERLAHTSTIRATGVEYVVPSTGHVGKFLLRNTLGEVIVSTGAIMTPQLLMNSGIGNGGSILDLPGVGKNLQDHPVVAMAFNITPDIALEASSVYTVADEMEDYFLSVTELSRLGSSTKNLTESVMFEMTGRLGTFGTAGFSAGAFLRSPWAEDSSPDIQLTVFPRQIEPHVTRQEKPADEMFLRSRAMLVTVALLRPDARYEVYPSKSDQFLVQGEHAKQPPQNEEESRKARFHTEVDPTNPLAVILDFRLPTIDLPVNVSEYLSNRDVIRLAWGIEQVRKIHRAPPLANHTQGEIYPGEAISGKDLLEYIRRSNLPNSHWVGSTKMGTAGDPMAVVDEEMRVHGTSGLRIVDAGTFPDVPNGNTHSTVCVVARRAAELIATRRGR